MPTIDLQMFHVAVQSIGKDNAVVVVQKNAKTGHAGLSGITLAKAQKVDGLETRQAFFSALVKQGGTEEYVKEMFQALGLHDKKIAHTPLTAIQVRACLDRKSQITLDQFELSSADDAGIQDRAGYPGQGGGDADGFEILEKPGVADGFEILNVKNDAKDLADIAEAKDADKVRDANLQQRRDVLSAAIRGLVKVTDAQLQRLDVQGLKDLLNWIRGNAKDAADPAKVEARIDLLSISAEKINQDELITSVERLNTDGVFAGKVEISDDAMMKSNATPMQNFLADLVFDGDTVLHDTKSPEECLLRTLRKHKQEIKTLLTQKTSTFGSLSPLAYSTAEKVRKELIKLFGYEEGTFDVSVFELVRLLGEMGSQIDTKLDELEKTPEALAQLVAVIDSVVTERCAGLQTVLADAFEGALNGGDVDMSGFLEAADPESMALLRKEHPDLIPELQGKKDGQKAPGAEVKQAVDNENSKAVRDAKPMEKTEIERLVKGKALEKWPIGREDVEEKYYHSSQSKRDLFLGYIASQYENDEALQKLLGYLERDTTCAANWTNPQSVNSRQSINSFVDIILADTDLKLTPVKSGDPSLEKLKNMSLDDVMSKGALDPAQGFGKFLLQSLKTYFNSVSGLDKRSMFASLLRHSPTVLQAMQGQGKVGDQVGGKFDIDLDFNQKAPSSSVEPGEKSDVAVDMAAATLGAFFKGAGPVLQKFLQQLSSMPLPAPMKKALADMRSNLLPMSDTTVRALLAKMVEDSGGAIQKVTVLKTLGAASVAQSLLCEITRSDGTVDKEVVVKLVRPDAAYRADREKKVFLDAAGTDEGMKASFRGRLMRIMEEFDLEIETTNAELGKVYNQQSEIHDYDWNALIPSVKQKDKFADVQSVSVHEVNPMGSHSAMIMKKAPGTTLDRKMDYFGNALRLSQSKWNGLSKIKDDTERNERYVQFVLNNHDKLVKLHDEMMATKEKALHFAHQWVNEALYGSGFFHGDAHAGNIMIGDGKLTAIDFGNATLLTPHEQKMVLRVVGACQNSDLNVFLDSFRELLSPGGQTTFDAKRETIARHIKVLMDKKTSPDMVGKLIAASITELQRLEVEIPTPIFNFSTCQLMLQTTIEDLDKQISELRVHMNALAARLNLKAYPENVKTLEKLSNNYSIDRDDAVGIQIRKFLHEDALKLEFDDFEKDMAVLMKGNDALTAAYDAFSKQTAYKDCKAYAEARDLLKVMGEAEKRGFGKIVSVQDATDRLNQLYGEINKRLVNISKLSTNYPPSKMDAQEIKRLKREKQQLDAKVRPLLNLIALLQKAAKSNTTVEAMRREAETKYKNFKPAQKAALVKARGAFSEFFVALRKSVIAEEGRKLKDDLKIKNDLMKAKNQSKADKMRDERNFLTVMGSSIFDHKWKTATSLGFVGTLKYIF